MLSMQTKQQIEFLSETLGIDISMDHQQQILLLIDGYKPVSVQLVNGEWYFYAMICHASDIPDSTRNYKMILSANKSEAFNGGGLYLDESANAIIYKSKPCCSDHPESLYDALDTFINHVDVIREMIESNSS